MPWTLYTPRPATSAAARALIEAPALSDALLAERSGASTTTIGLVRARLESMGAIPRIPVADRLARPKPPPPPSPTALAIAAGARTPREIADAAGVSMQAAWRAWRRLNPPLADAAGAVETFSVSKMPRQLADTAAAADAICVVVTITCGWCTQPFTVSTRNTRRRFCGDPCRDADAEAHGHRPRPRRADPSHPFPVIRELPPPPDWSRGTCAHVPPSQQSWWTSTSPVLREAAAHLCETCPILAPCAEFSLSLPVTDNAVWAGQTQTERLRRKRDERRLAAGDKPPPRNLG